MLIRVGYEFTYDCPQPTPMIVMLHIHDSRDADIVKPDTLRTTPQVPVTQYRDTFGNLCSRLVAPAGGITLAADGLVRDTGEPDAIVPDAIQHPVEDLPAEMLLFLLPSRYCETDLMLDTAWQLFGKTPPGWARVQAICDYVNSHIGFGYQHACSTAGAWDSYLWPGRFSRFGGSIARPTIRGGGAQVDAPGGRSYPRRASTGSLE